MGRIQANVGLITGVPITDTVNQLIAVSAQPVNRLSARNQNLGAQQLAVTELTALTLGVQFASRKFGESSVFTTKNVTSSNQSLISAAKTGEPIAGDFQFTPARLSQSHQLLGSGVAARDSALGEGELRLQFGGFVNEGVDLNLLNSGAGISRGKIKITDRSGESEIVDLRFVQTIDDVIETINNADGVSIQASAVGDKLQLTDLSGQTTSNLSVQEVGSGSTAADLGLAGIDVAADSATGSDLLELHETLSLDQLNGGSGLSIREGLPDLTVSLQDGSSLSIEFTDETSLGDLIDTINAEDPAKLQVEIAADGDRLEFTDLTVGGGSFEISSALSGELAEDLQITGTAVGGVITGGRLLGGLKTSLLSNVNGGNGLGDLGEISLTDRSGANDTVDLSAAESLDDIITAINAASVDVTASYNSARNGIQLSDTSGATASNLIVANNDATNTADLLGISFDESNETINSGVLNLQTVSENTKLSSLNGSAGVSNGSFIITDADGESGAINTSQIGIETIGDVISAINGLSIGVKASINETGDGILLSDTIGNGEDISVRESGGGSTAADLKLLGDVNEVDINGQLTKVIDGSTALVIDIEADDTLEDIVDKVNDLSAGVNASIFSDGSGVTPFRLSIRSEVNGKQGELLVDSSDSPFSFETLTRAQDALLVFGEGAGVLTSSSTNTFEEVLDGVSLTLNSASTSTVTVNVAGTDSAVVSTVGQFVDAFNRLRDKLDEVTAFDETSSNTGTLFGSNETLRVESALTSLVSGRIFGAGSIQSLAELGVNVKDDGSLELDRAKLQEKFAADPAAVEEFFTKEDVGVSARFEEAIESLAGEGNSLLVNRAKTLQVRIDSNTERIDFLTERLESERELLLKQFFNLEIVIGRLQNNLSAIQAIQPLTPL